MNSVSPPDALPPGSRLERAALPLALAFAALYAAVFGTLCTVRYAGFGYSDFDLAIFDQAMWNTLHGRFMDSSIRHVMLFGDHFAPILLLLLPVYAIFPSPLTLLWAQALVMAAGAIPLYVLGRREVGAAWGLLLAALYLLYPALGYANLFEFHTETIATFLLLGMFAAARLERFVPFIAFLLLALLCKEDVSLGVAAFGIVEALGRAWRARTLKAPGVVRWGLVPAAAGAAWFVLATQVWIPHFSGGGYAYAGLYAHLGGSLGEIARSFVTRPLQVLEAALSSAPGGPDKGAYLVHLMAPVGFLPLFSPATLGAALPPLLQNLLANYAPPQTIHFQYTSTLTPVVFLSSVLGLRRLLGLRILARRPIVLCASIAGAALAANLWLGPHARLATWFRDAAPDSRDGLKSALVARIPPDAAVTATFEFLPHLSARRRLESFHNTYVGHDKITRAPYVLGDDVGWALIDLRDPITFGFPTADGPARLRDFLDGGRWGVVRQIDDLLLLTRGAGPPPRLANRDAPPPTHPVTARIAGSASLIGFDASVAPAERGCLLSVELVYQGAGSASIPFREGLRVVGPDGRNVARAVRSPCGGALAPAEWPAGERVGDPFTLHLPPGLAPGRYSLLLSFLAAEGGPPISVGLPRATRRDDAGRIVLWEFAPP